MNVFPLHLDKKISASWNVDNHLHKIILESMQMLSHFNYVNNLPAPYKFNSAQYNHPLSKWIRESRENWFWIVDNMYALQDEWRFRYGHSSSKKHLSIEKFESMEWPLKYLPDSNLTPLPKSMPVYCQKEEFSPIPINSYQEYYRKEKTHLFKWTKREMPEFIYETL